MSRDPKPERRHDIDWLRVLAVLLLIYFHTARIFDTDRFYVKNDPLSTGMQVFISLVNMFHMPLLFLVSGVGTWFALGFRTGSEYARERIRRLFVPFIFGTLVIVPPQVYCILRGDPANHASYLEFYPQFFKFDLNTPGYAVSFEWGHLWFLLYLFVFSLLALPLFLYLRKEQGRRLVSRIAAFCERPGAILLPAIPLAVFEGALRPAWPGLQTLVNDWANVCFYITVFIYGFLLFSDPRFGRAIERHGKTALALGIGCVAIGLLLFITGTEPARGYSPGYVLLRMLHGVNTWFWLVAILAFGRKRLNFGNRLLDYANETVLPFYIWHQTVIVVIGFFVVRWPAGVMTKYLVISTASLIATVVLCEVLVKPTNVTRFLFGMRPKKRRVPR